MTTNLSERRKHDRELMSRELEELILASGASFDRQAGGDYPGPRAIALDIETPRGLCVRVELDGDSCQPDVHVLSWHMNFKSTDTLDPLVFGGDVNPHHFCKATYIAYGFQDLCQQLKKGLELAVSGAAFRTPVMRAA